MSSAIVSVIAQLTAKRGQEEELGRRLRNMIPPTLAEKGCINYDLHRDNDDPATWVFYENWQSMQDLDAHIKSKHFLDFQKIKDEVLAKEMLVQYLTPEKKG